MLQQGATGRYVFSTGAMHSVRELLDSAIGHLDRDWQKYVKLDPR